MTIVPAMDHRKFEVSGTFTKDYQETARESKFCGLYIKQVRKSVWDRSREYKAQVFFWTMSSVNLSVGLKRVHKHGQQ